MAHVRWLTCDGQWCKAGKMSTTITRQAIVSLSIFRCGLVYIVFCHMATATGYRCGRSGRCRLLRDIDKNNEIKLVETVGGRSTHAS